MTSHTASCRCGQLEATATGEPVRVSVCHCLDCQKRDGQRFLRRRRAGRRSRSRSKASRDTWSHFADSGNRITHHFCPECGSTVHYAIEGKFDGLIAIPLGAFADPHFPRPRTFPSGKYASTEWVEILGEDVEHID